MQIFLDRDTGEVWHTEHMGESWSEYDDPAVTCISIDARALNRTSPLGRLTAADVEQIAQDECEAYANGTDYLTTALA